MAKQRILISAAVLIILALIIGFAILAPRSSPVSNSQKNQVVVNSCGDPVAFDSVPKRVLVFDTNMTEMLLELGLGNKLVGYWISGLPVDDKYQDQIKNVPIISKVTSSPPNLETVLSYNPDFVFGAWDYNFSETGGVTPQKLDEAGIKSYILSESCTAGGRASKVQPDETMESTYQDIINLGKIFNVQDKAEAKITQMKANIKATQEKIGQVDQPLRGFYYGGGRETAFTAGKYAMSSKMMDAVGAKNILRDVDKDWIPSQGWELIINRDPQFVLIDDTPWESAQKRIETLESLPQLANITAIKQKRYIVLPWRYILPGISMDEGVNRLAKALYPDEFPQ